MTRISNADVETRWTDAVTAPAAPAPGDPVWSGATMEIDRRVVDSSASPDDLFWAVTRTGGDVGYYAMDWACLLRGWADQVIGGVGLRRGRRDPEDLRPGEALDFFRVAEIDPSRRHLQLQAEMKVPGTAWLEWTVEPTDQGSRLTQIAQFAPRGVAGRSYWWGLLLFHAPIFRKMSHEIARTAEHR